MPRYILKLDEWYFEWSTIVDAPVTYGMTLEDFNEYYQAEYGLHGMKGLDEQLERVEKTGTSAHLGFTAEELILFNRAGDDEANISKEMILEKYVLTEPEPEDEES